MDAIKIQDSRFENVAPEDVSYSVDAVIVSGVQFKCVNPRLEFARVLAQFEEIRYWNEINGSKIRDNSFISINAMVGGYCVIGGDGFGYIQDEKGDLVHMPHRGNVRIEAFVEIHNGVCIDRAVTGSTVIGEGSKIDNLVHIAHGVKIGPRCQIVAGSVIGGSTEIGEGTFVGINASIKNKLKIGRQCIIGMGAIVLADVPDGQTVTGIWKGLKYDS